VSGLACAALSVLCCAEVFCAERRGHSSSNPATGTMHAEYLIRFRNF
jgi:hypothetical protein